MVIKALTVKNAKFIQVVSMELAIRNGNVFAKRAGGDYSAIMT